jgi:SAM-dependent methyltransferase
VDGAWIEGYYGELYRASVAELLTPRLSALEADLVAGLLRLRPGERVADLGCGFGRHAAPLAARGLRVVGLERSGEELRRAAAGGGGARYVRADLLRLPLRPGAFDAAFSWYASLFMWSDAANAALLRQVGALLRPGGRLLVHHGNPLALAGRPAEVARRRLPGGGLVEEWSCFDSTRGVDRCRRRLTTADRRVLEGTAELRYYSPSEWAPLAAGAGLRLVEVTSSTPPAGGAPGPEAPDLIALLETP